MQKEAHTKDRKKDHIALAFDSQIKTIHLDDRFFYEPLMNGHPKTDFSLPFSFARKQMRFPMWVSSMTGGTAWALKINQNLARVCHTFGLGMGLGSLRPLLDGRQHFDDFNVRPIIGDDLPLLGNIGIAQLQELLENQTLDQLIDILNRLQTDGLIVHINPLQEWVQPEGDRYYTPPIESIETLIKHVDFPVVVKEVGHGMGYESLKRLLQLPLEAIDFGANGGTNFSKLEMLRSDKLVQDALEPIANIGHSAFDMLKMLNQIIKEESVLIECKSLIVSGGVKNFLDGYYYTQIAPIPAMYGQASGFLKYAKESYEELEKYVELQIEGLKLAHHLLRIRQPL